jgi:hypothetical protein
MAADGGACIICLDTSPPPIQSGCACRGDSGLAHIACLVRAAASQYAFTGASTNNRREHQGWGFPNLQRIWDRLRAESWFQPTAR